MMQPSDLDRKILPLSPSHVKKQNRASAPTAPNHLSAVPHSVPNHKDSQEMSPPDISTNEKNWISENPKPELHKEIEKQSPESLTNIESNGNGRGSSVATTPGAETPKMKMFLVEKKIQQMINIKGF